jgi:microcystin-dependent protein
MADDANGTYSLPSGYLAQLGETIEPSQHNASLEDIATALTARVSANGAKAMTGPLKLPNGTEALPALAFASATSWGFYKTAGGVGLSIAGVKVFEFGAFGGGRIIGELLDWPSVTPPTGWLACQGQSLLRATYPALFTVLGTTYGSVDGTHFTLPNLQGIATVGLDQTARALLTGSDVLGNTVLGSQTATISIAQMPVHTPAGTNAASALTANTGNISRFPTGAGGGTNDFLTTAATGSTTTYPVTGTAAGQTFTGTSIGSGAGHANVQPSVVVNKIIFTGVA